MTGRHGFFFDLDGTLVDTHASNAGAYAAAISHVLPGRPFDRDGLLAQIMAGKSSSSFLPELLPGLTQDELDAVNEWKALCYPEFIPLSRLNGELVGAAREWKMKPDAVIVLVTTAKRRNAENVLSFHGIGDLFDYAVFGDGVGRLKPAPDIYLKALELTGLRPQEAEAFEDSQAGIDAARAAGLKVTRVTWKGEK